MKIIDNLWITRRKKLVYISNRCYILQLLSSSLKQKLCIKVHSIIIMIASPYVKRGSRRRRVCHPVQGQVYFSINFAFFCLQLYQH